MGDECRCAQCQIRLADEGVYSKWQRKWALATDANQTGDMAPTEPPATPESKARDLINGEIGKLGIKTFTDLKGAVERESAAKAVRRTIGNSVGGLGGIR